MSSKYHQLLHLWLFPDNDFVFRIAVSADQLVYILRVNQIADLTTCVYPVHWLAGQGVPETDASISCSTSTAHGTVLMRRPSDGFDCSEVLAEFCLRLYAIGSAPYHKFVVITSGGQLLLIWAPFESTDLLLVTFKLSKEIILLSHISMQNGFISGPTA